MKSLTKMIKSMLINNLVLKISSLVLAAVIWMGVVNIDDPTKLVTIYNIPVSFTNEEVITNNNQIYKATTTRYVNVTISGRRSVVKDLTSSSFLATASLAEMSITNAIPVNVSLKNKSLESKVSIDNQSITQIQLEIEDVETKTYTVETVITGNVAMNYELSDITLGANTVEITAPASKHSQISKAVVNVDVSDATSSFKNKYKLVLLNQSGNKMSFGEDIIASQKKFSVKVNVLKLVRVPIVVELQGELPEGYQLGEVTIEPTEITLSGKEKVVNGIESVIIADDAVDISELRDTTELTLDLSDYVSEGINIREKSEVTLSIEVFAIANKEITVNPNNIKLSNVPSKYSAEILTEDITFEVTGKDSIVNKLVEDDFEFKADCSEISGEKGTVVVEVISPEDVEVVGTLKIKVKLQGQEEEESDI